MTSARAADRGDQTPQASGSAAPIGRPWTELDTPALLVDLDRLERNIEAMAGRTRAAELRLRPHFKTHKSVEIARRQLAAGALGLTVAKLDEAEALVDAGIAAPILVAYEIVASPKLERATGLARRVPLILAVDSVDGATALAAAAARAGQQLEVWLEIDSGLRRCGVVPEAAAALALAVADRAELRLTGVFTHGGQAYGAPDRAGVERVGVEEAAAVVDAAARIREAGIDVAAVSTGSTPTAATLLEQPGLTEIRPGNYVYYDRLQVALGTVALESCALTVAATVISRPAPDRAVIDAGSKTLGLDRGAHSTTIVEGFGEIVDDGGIVVRLSEEHGVVQLPASSRLAPGDRVRLFPNHACTVVNLGRRAFGLRGQIVAEEIAIDAAGGVH